MAICSIFPFDRLGLLKMCNFQQIGMLMHLVILMDLSCLVAESKP